MSKTRVSEVNCEVTHNRNTVTATLSPASQKISPEAPQDLARLIREIASNSTYGDEAKITGPFSNAHLTMSIKLSNSDAANRCENDLLEELRKTAPSDVRITELKQSQSPTV